MLGLMPVELKQVIYGDLVADAFRAGISVSTTGLSLDEAIILVAMALEGSSTPASSAGHPQPEEGQFDDAE